jgi:uncharacterized SAM-binding protein YcdF (DUF218 family)
VRKVVTLAGAAGAAVVGAEVLNRSVSPASLPRGARVGVVALGYPATRDGDVHAIARWRVETAVRVARVFDAELVVMSGGPTRAGIVEADVMLDLAARLGVPADRLAAERRSRSTWENVRESAPLVRHCDVVLLVSDPLHARRARRYWLGQFPADQGRVFVAVDRRPFERWWLLTPTTLSECALALHERLGLPIPKAGRWRRVVPTGAVDTAP